MPHRRYWHLTLSEQPRSPLLLLRITLTGLGTRNGRRSIIFFMRLLLVEDSARLQELLGETLRGAGYKLDVVSTVAALLDFATTVSYDVIIVDRGLPDGDGLDAIEKLRQQGKTAPMLIITARGGVDDRITGLDRGADDYLIKPFNHGELLARVRALLRRPMEMAAPKLTIGNITFDEAACEFYCLDRRLELRLSERRLLSLFMRHVGIVQFKAALEVSLSEFGRELSPNAIEALVSRTRKVLSDAGADPSIETVRGVGYIMKSKPK
jgi:two-component system OmpR family response regulator